MSENQGVYIPMKSAKKAMNGFCTTRVMDVLSVFTFSYLKCLHSWRSISNFTKIFVAEGNSNIFFVPFSYEHFTFHVYSPSLKCLLVRFDCVDTNRANKNYQTWQRSLAVHFISSFINHKWDLVCYLFSNLTAPNITANRRRISGRRFTTGNASAVRETPDFKPFLPVSRLESQISRIIAEVCHFL